MAFQIPAHCKVKVCVDKINQLSFAATTSMAAMATFINEGHSENIEMHLQGMRTNIPKTLATVVEELENVKKVCFKQHREHQEEKKKHEADIISMKKKIVELEKKLAEANEGLAASLSNIFEEEVKDEEKVQEQERSEVEKKLEQDTKKPPKTNARKKRDTCSTDNIEIPAVKKAKSQ